MALKNEAETEVFANKLGSNLKGSEVISFISDLGGGKTTIIKSIVKGTGSKDSVSSPTFTICNTYKSSKFNIYHFDFYRLNDPGVIRLQLEENIKEKDGVVLIEWPEIIKGTLPENSIQITIEVKSENERKLNIEYDDNYSYLLEGII